MGYLEKKITKLEVTDNALILHFDGRPGHICRFEASDSAFIVANKLRNLACNIEEDRSLD